MMIKQLKLVMALASAHIDLREIDNRKVSHLESARIPTMAFQTACALLNDLEASLFRATDGA